MSSYVIIGAGISGCTAANELVRLGHQVTLLDASNVIGGAALHYTCKATDECSRCGVCVANTQFQATLTNQRITTTVGVSIQSVAHDGQVTIKATRQNPSIDYQRCRACDQCVHACPVHCISKMQRGEFVQYAVDYGTCLLHHGQACTACVASCPSGAIFAETPTTVMTVFGDAVLLVTGHEPYNAAHKPRLGYGRIDGVLNGAEAEEILGCQTFLRYPADDIAFIQCVGSRDPAIGRNYCSSVCCAYALRLARMIKYRNAAAPVTVYYIDLQNFDKTFTAFRQSVEAAGVRLVRGVPFSVERSSNGRLKLHIEHDNGEQSIVEHDLVVLSVGLGPTPTASDVAALFSVPRDEFGFFSATAPNVFVSGTCKEPLNIPDSMASARAVALEMMRNTALQPTVKAILAPSEFERKTIPLQQSVLVIGGGIAGVQTAREIQRCGYAATLIEQSENLGGQVWPDVGSPASLLAEKAGWKPAILQSTAPTHITWKHWEPDIEALAGVTVLTQGTLRALTGNIGNFTAHITTPDGETTVNCGVVIVASGVHLPVQNSGFSQIVSLFELEDALGELVKKRGMRSIGLILDIERDETKAKMEMAFRLAQNIQRRHRYQVHLFCRDVRVAAKDLERQYDEVRESGVTIVKYDDSLILRETETGVEITCMDSILRQQMTIVCDRVGVSPFGRDLKPDLSLAELTKLSTDVYGQFQDNNIHLFPEQTNRPGVFVVGACRGQDYVPQILTDAKATALAVHALLSQKTLEVEFSNAAVDADKCALCLTCVRSCPHQAMQVNRAKGVAESLAEVCQRCGICAGECPAKAITLPLYTDASIMRSFVPHSP